MLLLTLDAILLLLITLSQGVLFKKGLEKLFRTSIETDLLGIFLAGLIFSTVYFSLVSFWWPVNFLCLLPLVAAHLLFFVFSRDTYRQLVLLLRQRAGFVFRREHALPAVCLLLLLYFYLARPPGNPDSVGYHYLSILWYEKFKVVPGLANLHGRYAFNPASFILQAAYSFTGLTGRSIYPLNCVTTGLFLYWLLARILRHRRTWTGLVYFILLLILGRETLGNMSSPSSDLLVLVCVVYTVLRFFELLRAGDITPRSLIIPMLVGLFAPIAKLSAYPMALILVFMLYRLPGGRAKMLLAGRMALVALLLYLPWLGRNVILSGWLVYPFPYADFFHADWKAPKEVLLVDYYFARYSPILGAKLLQYHQRPSLAFRNWFPAWFLNVRVIAPTVFLIMIVALCSPLLWLTGFIIKRKPVNATDVLYWLVYAMAWAWVLTSPDIRFGMNFLALSIALALLPAAAGGRNIPAFVIPVLFTAFTGWYLYAGYIFIRKDRQRRIDIGAVDDKNPWIYPLQHPVYMRRSAQGLPYTIMNTGVKLYHPTRTLSCNETCLPCMSWPYGEIEMRGNTLSEGFRTTRNEVKKVFPFVSDTYIP